MTGPSVFISYSHKDEEWKDRIGDQFCGLGRGREIHTGQQVA